MSRYILEPHLVGHLADVHAGKRSTEVDVLELLADILVYQSIEA